MSGYQRTRRGDTRNPARKHNGRVPRIAPVRKPAESPDERRRHAQRGGGIDSVVDAWAPEQKGRGHQEGRVAENERDQAASNETAPEITPLARATATVSASDSPHVGEGENPGCNGHTRIRGGKPMREDPPEHVRKRDQVCAEVDLERAEGEVGKVVRRAAVNPIS